MKPKASEALYKSLFENTLDGLAYCQMVFDTQGRPVDWIYVNVNKNFYKLMGLKGAIGKKVTELAPGITASNPELFEIYGRVSLNGKPERFETYVKPLSRWFLVSVYCPQKEFFVAVFQNITDQKVIEKNLENQKIAAKNVLEDLSIEKSKVEIAKAKEEAILFSIGDGLLATDEKGNITLINKMAEKLLGKKSEEVMGKSFFEITLIEDEKEVSIPFEKHPVNMALAGGTTTTTTDNYYHFVRKDETRFPVAIIATPVIIDSRVVGAVMVFRDITKEKEIEKLRTDFLSLASHQLRTPLSGTKWLIETMQRKILGPVTQKQKAYLDQIYQNNERMIKLVFDMLNVLRLESKAMLVKKETISIAKLYADLFLATDSAAKNRGVVLRNTLKTTKLVMVETDVTMLKSILACFVSNAINYSMPGQEVILDANEEPTAVVFFVKDSGVGIPEEEQKRIFERFYRASNAKIVKPDGTGLGLYIASMLTAKIGATMSFESKEDKGTTFYLRVPKRVDFGDKP